MRKRNVSGSASLQNTHFRTSPRPGQSRDETYGRNPGASTPRGVLAFESEGGRRPVNRVLLVEDHLTFREPLAFMLDREPEFAVVAQAGSLAEARGVLDGVDLAVVDLDLPDGDGTDLIGGLRAANPDGMVLVLTGSAEMGAHARAVERGAAGVLHKSVRLREVIGAARRLVNGEPMLSTNEVVELLRIADRNRDRDREAQAAADRLTPREREILQALAEGLSDKEISARLHVGVGTVRNHLVNVFAKLGTNSRLQTLVFALRHGVVEIT